MKKQLYIFLFLLILFFNMNGSAAAADPPTDMLYIPSGYAMMGAEYGDLSAQADAKPNHLVFLDAYYIDMHEVTNAEYAVCVAAGKCRLPQYAGSKTREQYFGSVTFANFPVVNISWQDAADYCAFAKKRLPTEAEWERAGRGAEDNRRYPWGNGSPKSVNINTTQIPGDTERVNIYAKGLSPYGAADMLGNVSEWVSDWYDAEWYKNDERENPKGPASGTEKTIRGSSFETERSDLHITMRSGMAPENFSNTVGFRCAADIHESVGYDFYSDEPMTYDPDFAYIKAGNENGIFLLDEPGTGYGTNLICVIPNGDFRKIAAFRLIPYRGRPRRR